MVGDAFLSVLHRGQLQILSNEARTPVVSITVNDEDLQKDHVSKDRGLIDTTGSSRWASIRTCFQSAELFI